MMSYLRLYIFCGIPVAAILFFIISLILFCYAKYQNKKQPGSFSEGELKTRKILLIISSVIAGVLALVIVSLIALLFTAVAFM